MDSDQSQQETFVWREEGYIAYGIVMFLILTVGFVGNVLTLLVLHRREHRKRSVTPLMINLAFADIFIIVFGYPVAISANFAGRILDEGSHCAWVGFINGTVGITSIITLTEMALVTYRGLKTVAISQRLSTKQVALLIFGAWLYGGLSMTPPLIGWNRFVLTSSKVSCCPDWTAGSASAISYNLLLVMVAFFIPLSVMIGCYYKICGVLRRNVVPENIDVQTRRRASLLKIVRMTAMSVLAFVLSWSPYCFVSLAAIFAGRHVMSAGEAEVPEMLAKASVVYNPIVYTAMNSSFRCTLWRLLRLHRRSIRIEVAFALKNDDCVRNGTLRHNSHQFKTVTELRVPSLVRRDTFKGIVMYND